MRVASCADLAVERLRHRRPQLRANGCRCAARRTTASGCPCGRSCRPARTELTNPRTIEPAGITDVTAARRSRAIVVASNRCSTLAVPELSGVCSRTSNSVPTGTVHNFAFGLVEHRLRRHPLRPAAFVRSVSSRSRTLAYSSRVTLPSRRSLTLRYVTSSCSSASGLLDLAASVGSVLRSGDDQPLDLRRRRLEPREVGGGHRRLRAGPPPTAITASTTDDPRALRDARI